MLAPEQEGFLLVKHPSPVWGKFGLAVGPPHTGFLLTSIRPYSSRFTDTKADKDGFSTILGFLKSSRILLRLMTLGLVGARGFEPPTSRSRTVRSSQAELRPVIL